MQPNSARNNKKLPPLDDTHNETHNMSAEFINQTNQTINTTLTREKQKSQRKQMHCGIFWVMMLSTLLLSFQNYVFFMFANDLVNIGVGVPTVLISFIIEGIICCKLTDSKWQTFQLFILLDNIFISLVAALLGFIGMILLLFGQSMDALFGVLIAILCISFTCLTGTYRVMLGKGKFPRYQVISMKITLILACLAYLILAVYYMQNTITLKEGSGAKQEEIKNFFFLYVFGFFTLFIQIFSKVTDLDGTGDLKYTYRLGMDDDDDENEEASNLNRQPENQETRIYPMEELQTNQIN